MVELSELSYYRYYRITVCYLIGRRSGHQNTVRLSTNCHYPLLTMIIMTWYYLCRHVVYLQYKLSQPSTHHDYHDLVLHV
ncbi:hypothetical protein LAZ67_12001639 [Cordylochernes scorpioides]|uniref:Uncharacterized protein n=1 Tax=Cordylochernes scorpioides TaxID=51811 RepID=A0ABY6L173_9ARAC|nr:hypothetical protein LAZ67_12001639 [Cordylochernes scorpioides]